METKLNCKGKKFFAPAIAAGLALAMAFTLNACGGDGGGDEAPASSSSGNGSPSSSSSGGGSLSSSSQPSHEHSWGEWSVTTAPTCEAGVETRTCAGDNSHKETRSIAKLFDWEEWMVKTPATPTTVGVETRSCPNNASPAQNRPIPMKCGGYNPEEKFCDERDEKLYKYVKINGQTWMAENLNHDAAGSKCYDNQESNCETYGRLYDWDAAMAGAVSSAANPSGVQGICPSGWHLPSSAEWAALAISAGGTGDDGETGVAGTKLKSTSGWDSYFGYIPSTNDYDFSALPGGIGVPNDHFSNVNVAGNWWSSSEYSSGAAYSRVMEYNREDAYWNIEDKIHLLSVRCLQD